MGRIENANQTVSDDGSIVRVKLPNKRIREQFAQAELMLGSNHIRVRCSDGVTRLGRIKGKIKKRVWIREGDILIVKVKKSTEEVFLLKNENGDTEESIYVRNLSSSDKLIGVVLSKFIKTKYREQIMNNTEIQ